MRIEEAREKALNAAMATSPMGTPVAGVVLAARKYLAFLISGEPEEGQGDGPWRVAYEIKAKAPAKASPKKAAVVKGVFGRRR